VEYVRVFPVGLDAPRGARHSLDALIGSVPPALLMDLRILMSEFVTNTVRHSGRAEGDPITVRVERVDEHVRIEVEDGGTGFAPVFKTPDPSRSDGWGLYIVDRLADRWGVAPKGVVWAEVDLPRQGA
jgi:anti-sigma regulatory factor (Ser/Thr protein kinase)